MNKMINATQLTDSNYLKLQMDEPLSKAISLFTDTEVILIFQDKRYQGGLVKNDIMKAKISLNSKVNTYLKHLPVIHPNDSIEEISRLMLESNTYQLPVFEKEKIIGVVNVDSILKTISNSDIGKESVTRYMTTDVISVNAQDRIGKAIKKFKEENISHLPVTEDKQITGIITMDDVISKIFHPEQKPSGWGKHGEIIAEKKHHLQLPIKGIMNKRPILMSPENQVKTVIDKMLTLNLHVMLLGEKTVLKGILTKKDLLEPIVSSIQEIPLFVQFAGELDTIKNFTKKEPEIYFEKIFLKYLEFLENIHLFIHLKQYDKTRRGVHLIYCKIRLSSPRGMFIASDQGWGFMQAIRETASDIEKQIRRSKR
jgi:predicted transcriptional regulator